MDLMNEINDKRNNVNTMTLDVKSARVQSITDKIDITSVDFEKDIDEVITAHNTILLTINDLENQRIKFNNTMDEWKKTDYIKNNLQDEDKGLIPSKMVNTFFNYLDEVPERMILYQFESIKMLIDVIMKLKSQVPRLKSQETVTESMKLANIQLNQFGVQQDTQNKIHNAQMSTIITNNNENIKTMMDVNHSNITKILDIFKLELSAISQLKLKEQQISKSYIEPKRNNIVDVNIDTSENNEDVEDIISKYSGRVNKYKDVVIPDNNPISSTIIKSVNVNPVQETNGDFGHTSEFIEAEKKAIQKGIDNRKKSRGRPKKNV